ncbi:MAG: carbon-nitrogen hydrolase family protein, partial [Alphaproteobacteria bacterium]
GDDPIVRGRRHLRHRRLVRAGGGISIDAGGRSVRLRGRAGLQQRVCHRSWSGSRPILKAYPNEPGVIAGNDFPTFWRSGVRYGVNICNDANHPGAAQRIADQDARLILYPLNNMLRSKTADRWRKKSLANLIDRARQTGCWVASADVTGASGNLISWGCTAIVTPEGSVVARVPELNEGVAVHEIPAS